MNAALLIGKHKSGGIPGKNTMPILGRPMVEYPLMAAADARSIDRMFVSTDSPEIAEIGRRYGAEIIERPGDLAQSESPTELAYAHGYRYIKERVPNLKYLVLQFANTPHVLPSNLDEAHAMLNCDDSLDSVISIVRYNMFSPMRARSLSPDGTTVPTLDLDVMGLKNSFHRDAMGDIYYVDFGVQLVRPERCLEKPTEGALPFVWMGHKQSALVLGGGFDIDEPWQIPAMEFWLKELGFTETRTPYGD
jgi:CMP-N-acetylneuraminic acid synthetase